MKITVPLSSRSRPLSMISVLTSLDALASGRHEITYALIVDDDDERTLKILQDYRDLLPSGTVLHVGKRDKILNARMNDAMNAHPADYYTFLPDDGFPLTQHWDAFFDGVKEIPAFAWCERNDPQNATFIAISERWREATGRGFPEYFPFWFADTWIMEVHMLAFAKPLGIVQQLGMGGKRGKTQGMRDLPFWFDFYAKTHSERIEEARKVAHAWGFYVDFEKDRQDQIKLFESMDAAQRAKIDGYAKRFGDENEPSEIYKEAKRKAEEWMKERAAA